MEAANVIQIEEIEETQEEATQEFHQNSMGIDDKAVMELAKRRLAAKRDLMKQVMDYFIIVFVMFAIMVSYDYEVWFVGFCFVWGLRLLSRIVRFAKPSFKDGVAAYFKERQRRNLEQEYSRLRNMKEETLKEELGM